MQSEKKYSSLFSIPRSVNPAQLSTPLSRPGRAGLGCGTRLRDSTHMFNKSKSVYKTGFLWRLLIKKRTMCSKCVSVNVTLMPVPIMCHNIRQALCQSAQLWPFPGTSLQSQRFSNARGDLTRWKKGQRKEYNPRPKFDKLLPSIFESRWPRWPRPSLLELESRGQRRHFNLYAMSHSRVRFAIFPT